MAEIKNNDVPWLKKFWVDFFKLTKKYWLPENNDTYWEQLTTEGSELGRKYDDEFCKGAVLFLMDYLEWKQIRESGKQVDDFCRWLYSRYQKNKEGGVHALGNDNSG